VTNWAASYNSGRTQSSVMVPELSRISSLGYTVSSLLPLQATSVITAVTLPTTMALTNRPVWFTSSIVCQRLCC
jgi:hypothetical protein